jgi:hypothetical protein
LPDQKNGFIPYRQTGKTKLRNELPGTRYTTSDQIATKQGSTLRLVTRALGLPQKRRRLSLGHLIPIPRFGTRCPRSFGHKVEISDGALHEAVAGASGFAWRDGYPAGFSSTLITACYGRCFEGEMSRYRRMRQPIGWIGSCRYMALRNTADDLLQRGESGSARIE